MLPRFLIMCMLFIALLCTTIQQLECDCLNGATCAPPKTQLRCQCPPGFLGQQCQLNAKEITSESTSVTLTPNYTYFYFIPKQVNYYKLIFTVCLHKNPTKKHTLFYIETQKNDGSLRQVPSLFETAKIVLDEDACTTFSTHYISIKRKDDQTFRKIIVGLKIMQQQEVDKYLNTYFSPQQDNKLVMNERQVETADQIQDITINMTYQVYLRTTYYSTFVIIFTSFVLLLILTSLLTFLKKKFTMDAEDNDPLRLTSFDLHYLARSMYRARRRYNLNPEESPRLRSKLALSNLQLFMPVAHYEASQSMLGEQEREEDVCSICLLEFEKGEETRMTPCNHRYHRDCFDGWWENNMNCPICRRELDFRMEMRQIYYNYLRNQLEE